MAPSQLLPRQSSKRQPKQPPRTQQDFDRMYEELSNRQKEVLFPFLEGKSDQQIARELYCEPCNIRRHLANVSKVFGLSDSKGDRCRLELIDVFLDYKPDWVAPSRRKEVGRIGKRLTVSKDSKPDIPGRPMSLQSNFYIQPSFEARCYEEIVCPGQLIRIRAPQLAGKTSLLYRILNYAHQHKYHTIALNLRYDVDAADLENLATFLSWFCRAIALSLGLSIDTLPTTKLDCTTYLQDQVLLNLESPLVIALDEVEVLFDHPAIVQEFFPLLRGWHESATEPGLELIWEKLRLVIVYSTESYLYIPFSPLNNVGYAVELPPLQLKQVLTLAQRYGLQEFTAVEGDRLMGFVGGHPYLIQQALYALAQEGRSLNALLTEAPTLAGIYRSHLQELLNRLHEFPQANLAAALKQVIAVAGHVRLNQEQTFKLVGLGLVQLQGNQVGISCELYRRFFQDWL